MRIDDRRWVGLLAGGVALVGACFEGPDWPPSVGRGTELSVGSASPAEAGTPVGEDAGDSSVSGGGAAFECNIPSLSECQIFTDVSDAGASSLQNGCTVQGGNWVPGGSCTSAGALLCCSGSTGGVTPFSEVDYFYVSTGTCPGTTVITCP